MPSILSLQHITKRFGYRCILNDISFSIEKGEFITLFGNNGAGKSTLLRIIIWNAKNQPIVDEAYPIVQ